MRVAIISRRQLVTLVEDDAAFALKLLESLADRLRELDKRSY